MRGLSEPDLYDDRLEKALAEIERLRAALNQLRPLVDSHVAALIERALSSCQDGLDWPQMLSADEATQR